MKRAKRRRQTFSISRPEGFSFAGMAAMMGVVTMMALGGGIPGTAILIAISVSGIVMIAAVAATDGLSILGKQPALFLIGLAGIALVPLWQIVPLPPSIWHNLAGNELRIRTLWLVGLENSWQPLSLTPLFTSAAALVAITFVALVTLLFSISIENFQRVAWLILAMVGVNIAIGLIQVATGGHVFQFHTLASKDALIGLFANKNHVALVLAASLPIAAYLLGSRSAPRAGRLWLGLYAGLVLVALVTTNSRAGIALGAVTMAILAALYVRSINTKYIVAGLILAVICVVLISTTSAFEVVMGRFWLIDQDLRWKFVETSRPLVERYWVLGSGIGSFSTIYSVFEHLSWVKPTYVNQMHDDYPQLLMEAGIPGVATLAALVVGGLWRAALIWRSGDSAFRLPVILGGLILALIAVHSTVDYPLHRPATLPVLALGIALAMRGDLVASTGKHGLKHKPDRASRPNGEK